MERDEVVGRSTGTAVITAERGPVSAFARAVTDNSDVYERRGAAEAAGFDDIPVPPTYFFSAAEFWGSFPEDQAADDPTALGPSGPLSGQQSTNPVTEVIGELMKNGGIILHGEQEFEYHRPIVVGTKLRREGRIADLYTKASGDRMMTFLVTENEYRDESGELVLTSRINLIHRA